MSDQVELRIVHISKDEATCAACVEYAKGSSGQQELCTDIANAEFPHLVKQIDCEHDCNYFVIDPANPERWWEDSDFFAEVDLKTLWVLRDELKPFSTQ